MKTSSPPGSCIKKIIKRDGRIVSFNKDKIVDSIFRAAVEVGGKNRKTANKLSERVINLLNRAYKSTSIPSVEEIQDIIEKILVSNGHYKTAKAFILYRAEHTRLREEKNNIIITEDNVPYKILWKVFTWNLDHSCDTVEKVNKHITDGTFKKLVCDSEKLYQTEIDKVAKKICSSSNPVKMVIVAGPSSSGKTTTTIKIGERLKKLGHEFSLISMDNYFLDLKEHPKDEYGDYDFESPEALDLELINEQLSDIINGKTVYIPSYDFKTGKRKLNQNKFRLKKNQILLIDSLHGLFPGMTSSIPHEMKFKFYIETLCQIRDNSNEFARWADLRMLRRMIRDSLHRSYNPAKTVGHWHYVRRSEKKHIVPFIGKADYVFNGSLPYELPVYKKYLIGEFKAILKRYENDPKKLDAYIRAKRAYKLLREFKEIKDESVIPGNSLIREFIGKSIYNY